MFLIFSFCWQNTHSFERYLTKSLCNEIFFCFITRKEIPIPRLDVKYRSDESVFCQQKLENRNIFNPIGFMLHFSFLYNFRSVAISHWIVLHLNVKRQLETKPVRKGVPGNTYWRGRISTIDLLYYQIQIGCF